MICDTFENIGLYCKAGNALYKAIAYARDFDVSLPDGEYEVQGRDIFAKVMTYETEPADERKFEAHKEYTDIQVILSGKERMDVAIDKQLQAVGDYNEKDDFILLEPTDGYSTLIMEQGRFAVFFPDDVHRPNCNVNQISRNRKICMKVKQALLTQ